VKFERFFVSLQIILYNPSFENEYVYCLHFSLFSVKIFENWICRKVRVKNELSELTTLCELYRFMTNFKFARLGLSYTSFSYTNAPGKKNIKTGFDQNKAGVEELQRGENHPLSTDLEELFKTICLMIPNSIPGFTLTSNTFVLQECNTLQVQNQNIFNCSLFRVSCFALLVPCYLFIILF
jgi:hypothetical protein